MKAPVTLSVLVLLLGAASGLLGGWAAGAPQSGRSTRTLALVGATVYSSPSQPASGDGVVLIRNGKIVAVGRRGELEIPPDAETVDCAGLTLTAGFWNSHVHLIEPKWENAASVSPSQLTRQLEEMFTRYGFTTVFDTGSYWEVTRTIRQRVESESVDGPKIFSTGAIVFSKGGVPPGDLSKPYGLLTRRTPEVENAGEAVETVRQELDRGVDAIKIYAQTWWNPDLRMPVEAVKAATAEAHRRGKLVFVHPSNRHGLEAAIESRADVLVHTTPPTGPWDETLVARMKQSRMALIPTLKMWRVELERGGMPPAGAREAQDGAVNQLRAYFGAGGPILFGTDVGYITDYDPTEEYQQMKRAGMRFQDILAALTTAPAERFGVSTTGRVAPGMDADVVVFAGDPTTDIAALSAVRYTVRKGKIIYRSKQR